MDYDVIIAGGGPAGMAAAIYTARAGLSTLIVEKMFLGGQMALTAEVENYPGVKRTSGAELALIMDAQTEQLGVQRKTAEITGFELGEMKTVRTTEGEARARALILAFGATPRKLDIPGEEKFSGRGVSYCATCDGGFYREKTVCVAGGGNTAAEDALYLAKLAKKVYLVHRREEFRAQDILMEQVKKTPNIEIVTPCLPKEILGDTKVTGFTVSHRDTQQEKTLPCDGVIVAVGVVPNAAVLPEGLATDEAGYVLADESTKTNLEGVFAAGDLRKKPLRQITTAVADGANAATQAGEYLRGR